MCSCTRLMFRITRIENLYAICKFVPTIIQVCTLLRIPIQFYENQKQYLVPAPGTTNSITNTRNSNTIHSRLQLYLIALPTSLNLLASESQSCCCMIEQQHDWACLLLNYVVAFFSIMLASPFAVVAGKGQDAGGRGSGKRAMPSDQERSGAVEQWSRGRS